MAAKSVVDAVEARLAANPTAGLAVVGVNLVGETPADGSPFVAVQYPVANSEQISIGDPGNNVWREEGVIRLIVNVDRGSGVAQGLAWADTLASLFRGKVFDGVTTWAPSSPTVGDDNDNGVYFVLSIAVPYQFDLIG